MLFEAPIIYFLILSLNSIDFLIGNSNLKFEKINISLNEGQLTSVLEILKIVRNWDVKKTANNNLSGNSYNPKVLQLPVKIEIVRESNNILIASYVNPNSTISNTSTFGERRKNIDWFEEVSLLVLEGIQTELIPKKVEQILEKNESQKSEFSFELLGKRIIAYSVIAAFFFVPYLYKESILFYPFLILPLIGIIYIIIDIKTIKMKSSR